MKSTYEARWGHKRGAGKSGKLHNQGKRIERERKRAEALERNISRAKRSAGDQLLLIALRPGNSSKEKARLRAIIGE